MDGVGYGGSGVRDHLDPERPRHRLDPPDDHGQLTIAERLCDVRIAAGLHAVRERGRRLWLDGWVQRNFPSVTVGNTTVYDLMTPLTSSWPTLGNGPPRRPSCEPPQGRKAARISRL